MTDFASKGIRRLLDLGCPLTGLSRRKMMTDVYKDKLMDNSCDFGEVSMNSTLPTVLDKLNVMSTIHLRKLIATLVRENAQRDAIIAREQDRIT